MYYHVIIRSLLTRKPLVKIDISEEYLLEEILVPYIGGKNFVIKEKVLKSDQVSEVKVFCSEQRTALLVENLKKDPRFEYDRAFINPISIIGNPKYNVTKDVTGQLLAAAKEAIKKHSDNSPSEREVKDEIISNSKHTENVDYSGQWVGSFTGTNFGNTFIELEQNGSNILGRVRVSEPIYGQYEYNVIGSIADEIKLTLTVSKNPSHIGLGDIAASVLPQEDGSLLGNYESTNGAKGIFKLIRPFADEVDGVDEVDMEGDDLESSITETSADSTFETVLEVEEQEIIDDEEEVYDDTMVPFNPAEINIVSEPKSLDLLIKRMKHDEIDLYTDFQRQGDLWDNHKMSRLIESILIRFPLPAFYFDASDDGRWLIVDGLQRLSAIKKFVIDGQLRLHGLEFLPELKGKKFKDLSRTYQRRIEECPITIYMIKAGTPDDVKYSIFHRINTGGLTLNTQEIRNALAKPRDRAFLKELTNNELFRMLLGDLSRRLKDQELILRFWAFYQFDYLAEDNKKDYKNFLDKAMKEIKNSDSSYKDSIRSVFESALRRCYDILGDSAFERNPDSELAQRSKNATLFEVIMVCLAKLDSDQYSALYRNKEKFRKKLHTMLRENTEFVTSITSSTQKIIHVKNRYKFMMQIINEEISYA